MAQTVRFWAGPGGARQNVVEVTVDPNPLNQRYAGERWGPDCPAQTPTTDLNGNPLPAWLKWVTRPDGSVVPDASSIPPGQSLPPLPTCVGPNGACPPPAAVSINPYSYP